MTLIFRVVCETTGCKREGETVNKLFTESARKDSANLEAIENAWGHGSEDPSDYCPVCGELGTLHRAE